MNYFRYYRMSVYLITWSCNCIRNPSDPIIKLSQDEQNCKFGACDESQYLPSTNQLIDLREAKQNICARPDIIYLQHWSYICCRLLIHFRCCCQPNYLYIMMDRVGNAVLCTWWDYTVCLIGIVRLTAAWRLFGDFQ